jgi:CBS domain-containing protein
MTTVQQLLDQKGHTVWSVGPEDSVFDAIKLMADRELGSVLVVEDGRLVGIFTERHYARNVFLQGRASPTTPVGDVMARRVVCARPQQTVDECMAVMTEKRVRHLPVLQRKKLVGLVSIGDLIKSKIADQEFTIEQLVDYIHG